MGVREDVEACIARRPGLTEAEIAEVVLGRGARQQQVNPSCRELTLMGRVERRGYGGPGDPFRYFPKSSGAKT
jgi:hypothetical protein